MKLDQNEGGTDRCDAPIMLYTCHHSHCLQLCRGAESNNRTMISTWYISAPSWTTYSSPRGSKRQMVVELLNWVSYQLTCGDWMLHVVMVTSHAIVLWFILSCRLLCSWFPRLWLILHKLVFFCLWVLADMHAIFYHWLMNDSVLFWLAFAMLGKIRRQYGFIFNLVVVCVLSRWDISVYVQAQTRSMLPYLTSFKHTLLYFSQSVQNQNLPRVLCVFTDSLFPPHILRLFLTVLLSTLPSHTVIHSHTHYPPLVLLGSPPGTNFPTFLPLFFSPSACCLTPLTALQALLVSRLSVGHRFGVRGGQRFS